MIVVGVNILSDHHLHDQTQHSFHFTTNLNNRRVNNASTVKDWKVTQQVNDDDDVYDGDDLFSQNG